MDEDAGIGWKLFAGIMIILVGTFNVIDGLVAITNDSFFKGTANGSQLPVTNDIKTWGWVVFIWGIILILAGFLIFSGNMFGRIVGVVVAGANAILQLAYLSHFPLWSFTMIIIDVLVIWAIVVHGGKLAPDM